MSRCELILKGSLAESIVELITSRHGSPIIESAAGRRTIVIIDTTDTAAERALLNLLWDTGHDIVAMRAER